MTCPVKYRLDQWLDSSQMTAWSAVISPRSSHPAEGSKSSSAMCRALGVWDLTHKNDTLCMYVAYQAHRVKMYALCGDTIDCVTQGKHPGAIISADLQWHSQVCAVAKKANTTLHFIIVRTLKYCPRSSNATACTSIVRSSMEYCAGIWYPSKQQDKNTLEKVNRWAARVVYNKTWRDRSISPTSLVQSLDWESLETRHYNQRMVPMYKITHKLTAVWPHHSATHLSHLTITYNPRSQPEI